MNNIRLTFNASTNFTLPIGTYQILLGDADYYGYEKNEKPNICGFLNELIPVLSDYQEDLYKDLLEYNGNDHDMAKAVARSIYNVYLRPFTFHDDGVVNVPFRISKQKYEEFIRIHDERLRFYNTDFTNYIRTLLVEYTSKSFAQREYMYAYRKLLVVREGIAKSKLCKFYHNGTYDTFVPVSVETSPVCEHNYIVGVTGELHPVSMLLRDLQRTVIMDEKIKITEDMCHSIYKHMESIYKKEYNECLA